MKRKLRDRLRSIERALKELGKKVRAIDLTHLPVSNRENDKQAKGNAIRRETSKEAVRSARKTTRKRRRR
jgi:hypothetical protein